MDALSFSICSVLCDTQCDCISSSLRNFLFSIKLCYIILGQVLILTSHCFTKVMVLSYFNCNLHIRDSVFLMSQLHYKQATSEEVFSILFFQEEHNKTYQRDFFFLWKLLDVVEMNATEASKLMDDKPYSFLGGRERSFKYQVQFYLILWTR